MILWDSPIVIGIIGFIGGILGGLIVNIISIKYQKNMDRKFEEEKAKIEYSDSLNALLNEIVETWEKELTKSHVDRARIQNDFDIYSRQLTSLIARASQIILPETLSLLRELSSSLAKLKTFPLTMNNYNVFVNEAEKSVKSAKAIRESLK